MRLLRAGSLSGIPMFAIDPVFRTLHASEDIWKGRFDEQQRSLDQWQLSTIGLGIGLVVVAVILLWLVLK